MEDAILPDTKKYRQQLEREGLQRAHDFFQSMIFSSRGTKDLLLDAIISPNPKGIYKTWEIELTFFHVVLKVGKLMFGNQFIGFVACHQLGSFTTYSVTIDGCEFWFDEFELAAASLYGGRSVFLNINSAPIKQLELVM